MLIICLDGLGYDMFLKYREYMPFLWSFSKENYFSRLKSILAYTGIEFSFFSGKWPDEHGVWTEFVYDKENSVFKFFFKGFPRILNDYFFVFYQFLKGRSFFSRCYNIPYDLIGNFDISVKDGLWNLEFFRDYVYLSWPYFVSDGKLKFFFGRSDKAKCKKLVRNFGKKNLYYVHLVEIDKSFHKFGFSDRSLIKLGEEDSLVKYLVNNYDGDVVIWSDHGFTEVKNYVDLEKVLGYGNGKEYLAFYDSIIARFFWFRDKESVLEKLKKLKCGRFISVGERKKLHIPLSKKYGEEIFVMNKGFLIFPNFYQSRKVKGMHGYLGLDGVFISNKKINKKVLNLREAYDVLKNESV